MSRTEDETDNLRSPSRRLPSDRHLRRLAEWARRRIRLVRTSANSALQVGLAAGLSWWLATTFLPWDQPIYAPIGAVVAIGTGEDRMLSRPLRLLGGMLIAVAVAGVVVGQLGSGAWQIVLITTVTTIIGRFLFSDALARTYSAFHGAVIGALGVNQVIPEQLVEASIGAVTGIVVVHLVFPPRVEPAVLTPVQYAGYAARRCVRALASALRTGHAHELRRAKEDAMEIEAYLAPNDQRRTFGRQLVRFAPARRRQAFKAERAIEADRRLTSVLLGVADLTRLAEGLMSRDSQVHPELSAAVEDLDRALGWVLSEPFDGELPDQIADSICRMQERLDSLEGMTRPQEMLCENLRELTEFLETVSDELAARADEA